MLFFYPSEMDSKVRQLCPLMPIRSPPGLSGGGSQGEDIASQAL